jgi:hypothetical protein
MTPLSLMSSPLPIFTDSPRQHPNLIIGALHLLAWMVFHPKAFRNYLTTLDSELEAGSSWLFFLKKGRWRRGKNIRFFLQSQIILPILSLVIIGGGNLLMGFPFSRVADGVALSVALSIALSVALGSVLSVALGSVLGVAFGIALGIADGVAMSVTGGAALDVAVGGAGGAALDVAMSVTGGTALGVAVGVAFGVVTGVPFGIAGGVAFGIGVSVMDLSIIGGVATFVGCTIHHWLPYIIYPLIQGWNNILYRLDRRPHKRQIMFIRWHSVGWYEWEHLPLTGLDQHLLLATEINRDLGLEAINYVSNTKQQWAARRQ